VRRNEDLEATIVAKFSVMMSVLDERARRLWAAAESVAIGYGGDALVSAATGLARETIRNAGYGYANWFLNTGKKALPSAPESAVYFEGNGANHCTMNRRAPDAPRA
jgi:hypothetical protein